jgi:hypothetical protein
MIPAAHPTGTRIHKMPFTPDSPDLPSTGFFTIPNDFIDCGNLAKLGPAALTYFVLLRHAGTKLKCFLRLQTIAFRINANERTVRRHIKLLVARKAITVKYHKRGASTFTIRGGQKCPPMADKNVRPKKNT